MKIGYVLTLIFLVSACNPDSSETTTSNFAPTLTINGFNCPSDPDSNHCHDIGVLSVDFDVSDEDGDLEKVTGIISSTELGLSQPLQLVNGKMQGALLSFSGATDVIMTLFAQDSRLNTTTVTETIGVIEVNSAPTLTINSVDCLLAANSTNCRDIGLLSVDFNVSDDDLDINTITATISSAELGLSQPMQLVNGTMQVPLLSFSGATDVIITLSIQGSQSISAIVTKNIGTITVNSPPTCTSPLLIQNFVFNQSGGSVALIDIATCSDPELDQITLSNQTLNTMVLGNYSNILSITDEFGFNTDYIITGNVARRNLTITEFINLMIAEPSFVGAISCFTPINQVFDEAVVCDFFDEWHGFQYGSTQSTAAFSNIALVNSAQGFSNLPIGPSLSEITAGFSTLPLPNNQVVVDSGNSTIAITATIIRDSNGNYSNSTISGGFNLQGAITENSIISCENQTYTLPISTVSNARTSQHTIDQAFIESVGQTQRISNCVASNNNLIYTVLEGEIDIVVTDLTNQNPVINSVSGITQGVEGLRTVIANVTDTDNNLATVSLRYRIAGSSAAWAETTLVQQGSTDSYSISVTFDYASSLDENGSIEYQIIAQDSFGGQGVSTLSQVTFVANEDTAQTTIEDEIALDPNKLSSCFDCSFTDPTSGFMFGSVDGLFNDLLGVNHAYEYNGEQRSAADMTTLENSVNATIYNFHEIPIGTVAQIRSNIQNN